MGATTSAEPPLPTGVTMDTVSGDVFRAFMRTMRLHGQLMIRMLAEQGSHPGQAICLRILANDDGLSQRDLAERLHLSRPTVTSMLQRLERSGSIERRVDEEDQRITRVHLTADGRRQEEELRASLAEYAGRILDPLPEPDRRDLARLLDAMADNLQVALSERTDAPHEVDMGSMHHAARGPRAVRHPKARAAAAASHAGSVRRAGEALT
jgi:DNA-binding MarR family transcriptional regulator